MTCVCASILGMDARLSPPCRRRCYFGAREPHKNNAPQCRGDTRYASAAAKIASLCATAHLPHTARFTLRFSPSLSRKRRREKAGGDKKHTHTPGGRPADRPASTLLGAHPPLREMAVAATRRRPRKQPEEDTGITDDGRRPPVSARRPAAAHTHTHTFFC